MLLWFVVNAFAANYPYNITAVLSQQITNSTDRPSSGPLPQYLERIFVQGTLGADRYISLLSPRALSPCALFESGLDPSLRYINDVSSVQSRDRRDSFGFWRRMEYYIAAAHWKREGLPAQGVFPFPTNILLAGADLSESCRVSLDKVALLAAANLELSVYAQIAPNNIDVPLSVSSPREAILSPVVLDADQPQLTFLNEELPTTGETSFRPAFITDTNTIMLATFVRLDINVVDGKAHTPIVRVVYSDIGSIAEARAAQSLPVRPTSILTQWPTKLLGPRWGSPPVGQVDIQFDVVQHGPVPQSGLLPSWGIGLLVCIIAAGLILEILASRKYSGLLAPLLGITGPRALASLILGIIGAVGTASALIIAVYATVFTASRDAYVPRWFFALLPVRQMSFVACVFNGVYYIAMRIMGLYNRFLIVDWETEKSVSKLQQGSPTQVDSFWRRNMILSQLWSLQRWRPVSYAATSVVAMLFLVGWDFFYYTSGSISNTNSPGVPDPTRRLLVDMAFLLLAYIMNLITGILRGLVESFLLKFSDYISLLNCSLFIFDNASAGLYIHGKAPSGTGGLAVDELITVLQRETKGLLPRRGLHQGSVVQHYRFFSQPNHGLSAPLGRIQTQLGAAGLIDGSVSEFMTSETFAFDGTTTQLEAPVANARWHMVSAFSRRRAKALRLAERQAAGYVNSVLPSLPIASSNMLSGLFDLPPLDRGAIAVGRRGVLLTRDPFMMHRANKSPSRPPGGAIPAIVARIFPGSMHLRIHMFLASLAISFDAATAAPIFCIFMSLLVGAIIDITFDYLWMRRFCETTLTKRAILPP